VTDHDRTRDATRFSRVRDRLRERTAAGAVKDVKDASRQARSPCLVTSRRCRCAIVVDVGDRDRVRVIAGMITDA